MPTGTPDSDGPDAAVEESRSGSAGSPVDLAILRRYTLDDVALQKEILDLFAGQLEVSVRSLRTAVTTEDWFRAAHTLKGSARAVGAISLASALEDAEALSDVQDTGRRQTLMARIEAEAGAVAAFIVSNPAQTGG